MAERIDLIVFSHLRWEFVFQRPQHLLTRLAKNRRVLFVEEPIGLSKTEKGGVKLIKINKHITVMQPRLSKFNSKQYANIVNGQIRKLKIKKFATWFYSAMFKDVLTNLQPKPEAVIYDCMDELSVFKGAPKELIRKEKELLEQAQVVFTGGKSLFEAKRQLHPNVFCFPSSVDQAHFATTLQNGVKVPADIRNLPKPIVGYYGVIDERVDLRLLKQVAQLNPEVSLVMIGPVVKISEADLPKQKNIYYLGSKDYKRLPQYLKAIDVAMMPFALNASTKFISPTKTLEYMAAQKPIISTPITDVVRDYKQSISIVNTAQEFTKALQKILKENSAAQKKRQEQYKKVLQLTSWDRTAREMEKIIEGM